MAVLVKIATGIYAFKCPGCGHLHQYWTAEAKNSAGGSYESVWDFNGNMDRPTFHPSLLNRWGKEVNSNWEEPKEPVGEGQAPWSGRCHLFVKEGLIEYCGDSWHKLANKTVPMVPLSEELVESYNIKNTKSNTMKVKPCVDNASKKPNGNYYFKCPATGQQIEVSTVNAWSGDTLVFGFNGDVVNPTFSQAIKVVNGKVVGKSGSNVTDPSSINHFVIQDGNIRYFEDSTHHMHGRTMELPELK